MTPGASGAHQAGVEAGVARNRLAARLGEAVRALPEQPPMPLLLVDLDAFDLNATDLTARAGGKPVRVASTSLRVPALLARALDQPGFRGVLAYDLREALWLVTESRCDDVVMGYPTVDRTALHRLVADDEALAAVTLMVDDAEHLRLVEEARSAGGRDSAPPVRVAVDVDAGLRVGRAHLGPRRSPLHEVEQVLVLAEDIASRRGFDLVGVMTYEGQVAGVPDDAPGERARSAVVRRVKSASQHQLRERRRTLAAVLRDRFDLQFWNAGGSGGLETSAQDPSVTEVTAGSGLMVPHLFDHYRSFSPRPAEFFALPVVRRPASDVATVAGGGLVASGPTGLDRSPVPWAPPGLHLTGLEGAGEVQTPLVGPAASRLAIGDLVWFRHAKAGEPAAHTTAVHLLEGSRITRTVPTYRGLGVAW